MLGSNLGSRIRYTVLDKCCSLIFSFVTGKDVYIISPPSSCKETLMELCACVIYSNVLSTMPCTQHVISECQFPPTTAALFPFEENV